MNSPILTLVLALGCVLLLGATALLVLRATGRIGPHRDIEAWSVRSPDAVSEDRRVAAQIQALRVEAGIVRKDYQPPRRREAKADA